MNCGYSRWQVHHTLRHIGYNVHTYLDTHTQKKNMYMTPCF